MNGVLFLVLSSILTCSHLLLFNYFTDIWEMPRSEIVLGDELGTGQFGVRMNISRLRLLVTLIICDFALR